MNYLFICLNEEQPSVTWVGMSLIASKSTRGKSGFKKTRTMVLQPSGLPGGLCVEPYADYPLKDSPFNRNTDKVEMN